jgi:glucose-6-phosphate 1-epimerase
MTLTELNQRFAISNHLQFKEIAEGMVIAEVANQHALANIALQGAHIATFQPRGEEPVIWLSPLAKFVPGKSIRGGVPICWPWFGANAQDPKLPMHGFARVNEWSVESTSESSITLKLEPTDAIHKLWANEFVARFTVKVSDALEMELEATNRSQVGVLIAEALHTYFAIGDIEQITLAGLTGTSFFDKVANERKIEQRDPVKLSGETDNVYLNTRTPVTINDPVMGRKIRVEKSGSSSTVLWNPFEAKAKNMADVGPGEWKKFVCVEAVNALENTITVAPGATHKISTTIKVI